MEAFQKYQERLPSEERRSAKEQKSKPWESHRGCVSLHSTRNFPFTRNRKSLHHGRVVVVSGQKWFLEKRARTQRDPPTQQNRSQENRRAARGRGKSLPRVK